MGSYSFSSGCQMKKLLVLLFKTADWTKYSLLNRYISRHIGLKLNSSSWLKANFQVINNACATQAIISILLNCKHPDLHLGPTLGEFREFTQAFDANMKGLALSNSDTIRSVHNSFARLHSSKWMNCAHSVMLFFNFRQTLFEFDSKSSSKDEDTFHFVGYVPIDGRLYELDGLKEGPIDLGAVPLETDWIDVVRPIIEKRIQRLFYSELTST